MNGSLRDSRIGTDITSSIEKEESCGSIRLIKGAVSSLDCGFKCVLSFVGELFWDAYGKSADRVSFQNSFYYIRLDRLIKDDLKGSLVVAGAAVAEI